MSDDLRSGTYGEDSQTIYDDLEGVSKVTSLPDDAPHRNVDILVLKAGTEQSDRIKTAIVCPSTIHGLGRGPSNKRSIQIPALVRAILERGHGIQVGAGKTHWGNIHVHDLSDIYLKLVENAAVGGSIAEWPGKPALWGEEGYYFGEAGEHVWGDVSQLVATEAHKQDLIKTDEVKSLSEKEANECTQFGAMMWGGNSRPRGKRARVALKWEPKGPGVEEGIKAIVEVEAKDLGMKPGHAKIAAGEA